MGELSYTVGGDSNLVSFKSAARVPITSLKAYFKPKQDLHGYSKPWPAGSGKNLFGSSFVNGNADMSTGGITKSAATFPNRIVSDYVFLAAGTYTFSMAETRQVTIYFYTVDNKSFVSSEGLSNWINTPRTFTIAENRYAIFVIRNANDSNLSPSDVTNVQVEKDSTATSYEPYENICPGTGWNEYEIYKTSYNIFDEEYEDGGLNDSTGSNYPDSSFIRSKNYIPCRPNTSYCFSYTHAEPYSANLHIYYYDINKQHIRNTWVTPKQVVTSHSRAYYMRFYMDSAYKRDGLRDVSINYPSTDTQYHAYCGESIPIIFPIMGKNKFNVAARTNITYIDYNEETNFFTNNTEDTRTTLEIYCEGWKDNSRLGTFFTYYQAPTGNITTTFTVSNVFEEMNYLRLKHNGSKRDFSMHIPMKLVVGQTYTFSMEVTGNDPTTIGGVSFGNIQIEFGDTATEYEPYSSDNTIYGGYVDAEKGEIYVTHIKTIIDGRYDFGTPNDYNTYYRFFRPYSSVGFLKPKYSTYPIANWLSGKADIGGIYIGSTGNVLLYIDKKLNISNSSQLSNYLNEHPLEVVYELDSPQIYPMSSTKLTSFIGHNVFYTNTNSKTQLSYAIHDTAPIRAAKHRIAANEPHIETIDSSLAHFETDMVVPLKECKVHFSPKQDTNGYGKVWIGGCGKNLFDPNCAMWNHGVYVKNGDTITQTGSDGRGWVDSNFLPIHLAAGTYTITCSDGNNFSYATSIENYADTTPIRNGTGTFTLTEDCDVKIKHSVASGNSYPTTFTVQLETGSEATNYEPYENICPITGWSGLQVHSAGKNLLRLPVMTRTNAGITWTVHEDGSIDVDGTCQPELTWMSNWNNVNQHKDFYLKAGTYKLSGNNNKIASMYLVARDGSTNKDIGAINRYSSSSTFTLAQDTLVGFQAAVAQVDGEIHMTFRPQLELVGPSEFESPQYNTIDVDWIDSVGLVYGGYIDLKEGKLIQTHKCITLNGSENWDSYKEGQQIHFYLTIPDKKIGLGKSICSHLPNVKNEYFWDYLMYAQYGDHGTLDRIYVNAPYKMPGMVTEWKAYLANHPMQLCYELAAPIEYSLTSTQLKTLRGQNNIWSNSNGNVSVKYWAH